MELRTIRYFLQLCKDLNFTVAASKLYITQQALSKAIGILEKELGVQLFSRQPSGVVLTEYGEYLRYTATPSVENLDKALYEIQRMRDSQHTIIRFGCTYGIILAMQQLIDDFKKQYPQTDVLIDETTDCRCEEGLQNGKYDIICITEPLTTDNTILIYEEPVVLVALRGGPLDGDLTPKMLTDRILIDGGTEFNAGLRLRSAFKRRGLNLTMKATSLDKTAFINVISEGQCALIVPQHESTYFISENMKTIIKQLPFEKEEVIWRACLKLGKNDLVACEVRHFANYIVSTFHQYISHMFSN